MGISHRRPREEKKSLQTTKGNTRHESCLNLSLVPTSLDLKLQANLFRIYISNSGLKTSYIYGAQWRIHSWTIQRVTNLYSILDRNVEYDVICGLKKRENCRLTLLYFFSGFDSVILVVHVSDTCFLFNDQMY